MAGAPPIRQVDIGPNANLPTLADPIGDLKYVGPFFQAQFAAAGVHTFNDLRNYFLTHTKAHNTTFLRRILRNPRRRNMPGGQTGCLDARSRRFGVGNRYLVRQHNTFAFNAIVQYFRRKHQQFPRNANYRNVNRRLPNRQRRRTFATAWPHICA